MKKHVFYFDLKDKSKRNVEAEEFQIKSREFLIYPKYNLNKQAQNFDICLIQISESELGINGDLSSKLSDLPCIPDQIDLKEVFRSFHKYF